MKDAPVRRPTGFSILELVVVLMLMSIVAAVIVGRTVTTANLELNAATDQVRNHLRYAQAEAMKRREVWGIKSVASAGGGQYWLFRGTNPDLAANEVRLPGVQYIGTSNKVTDAQLNAAASSFTLFFDRIGKPYTAYTSATSNTPLASQMSITVSAGGDNRIIRVTPETGLIR
jgi:prepilin-type N-terminal cleavage/methylation domain-containing protein